MEDIFGRFKDVLRFQLYYWKHDSLTGIISKSIRYLNSIRPIRKLYRKTSLQFRIEQLSSSGFFCLLTIDYFKRLWS